ncbi:MAG: WYL domain-containing protein [Burkholderiaceae bacterium]
MGPPSTPACSPPGHGLPRPAAGGLPSATCAARPACARCSRTGWCTGHHWYLVAWDPARDDWRTFRIDRVQGTPPHRRALCAAPAARGDLRAYVTGAMAGVHQQGEQARVVLHQPREVMANTIPIRCHAGSVDDTHCLMLCGTGQLDSLVYWLDARREFDVLEPPALKERPCAGRA